MPEVRVVISQTSVTLGGSSVSVGSTGNKDQHRVQKWTGDSLTAHYDLTSIARKNSLQVHLNGILQEAAGVDYTEDADRGGFTFAVEPETGDKVEARYVVA